MFSNFIFENLKIKYRFERHLFTEVQREDEEALLGGQGADVRIAATLFRDDRVAIFIQPGEIMFSVSDMICRTTLHS